MSDHAAMAAMKRTSDATEMTARQRFIHHVCAKRARQRGKKYPGHHTITPSPSRDDTTGARAAFRVVI
jgi:hypothetical protein